MTPAVPSENSIHSRIYDHLSELNLCITQMLHNKTFYANTFMTTLLICHQGTVLLKILVSVVQFRPEPPSKPSLIGGFFGCQKYSDKVR